MHIMLCVYYIHDGSMNTNGAIVMIILYHFYARSRGTIFTIIAKYIIYVPGKYTVKTAR